MVRALIPMVALLFACSAGRASVALVQADRAIDSARARGAAEQAAFEMRMAEAYLIKAREEAQFSSYRQSVELARGAADWADKAVITMESDGSSGADSAPDAPGGVTKPTPGTPEPSAEPAPTIAPAPRADPPAPAPSRDAWTQRDTEPTQPATEDAESNPGKVIVVPVSPPTPEPSTEPSRLIVVPRDTASPDDDDVDAPEEDAP